MTTVETVRGRLESTISARRSCTSTFSPCPLFGCLPCLAEPAGVRHHESVKSAGIWP